LKLAIYPTLANSNIDVLTLPIIDISFCDYENCADFIILQPQLETIKTLHLIGDQVEIEYPDGKFPGTITAINESLWEKYQITFPNNPTLYNFSPWELQTLPAPKSISKKGDLS
jgi:hypothetical protein